MAVTANSNNNVSRLDQVLDRNASPGQKWFSLQDNKLDGSYHPITAGLYNVALGKSASDPKITDGDINTVNWVSLSSPVQVDLGATYRADSIVVWHYYGDSRTYHNSKTQVSQDGVSWTTVFDSAVSGEYAETASGHTIDTTGMAYRYIRDYINGNTVNAFNHWVEIKVNGYDEVGWWGNVLSAADGTFGTAQTLTATYSPINSFNTLRLAGDSLTNDYPVNFTITLSKAGTTVKTVTVTGNASVNWSQALDKTYDADQMVISITKVNKGSRVVKILEASDLWQLTRVDAGTVSAVDQHTLVALSIVSHDAGTLSAIDQHNPITVRNTRTDAGTLAAVDSSFFTHLEKLRQDSLTLTQTETKTVKNSFARADAGTLSEVESHATTVKPTIRTDAGTLSIVENKAVTNRNTRTDSLVLTQVESKTPAKVSFTRPDSLKLTQVETKTPPKVSFTRPDLLKLTQAETKKVTAKLYRSDTPKIKQSVEADDVMAEFGSNDSLVVASSDISTLTNIHTIMDGDYRQIFGKVEISYTDPLVDGDVILTASSTTPGTSPDETADTKDTADYKWFSLQENFLDGTYHPVNSDLSNGSVGWWGAVLSDSSGILPQAEWLRADFSPRGIYDLKVIGDDKLNEFPVDFDVNILDTNGINLLTRQIRGNNAVSWTETLTTAIVDATSIILTIYKVNKANRTVKIVEFFASLVETYLADDIISINLLEEQNFTDMTLPIGNSSSNELEVRLYNLDRKFDADNDDSPLYGWLKKNRRVKAWLGAEVVPGVVEWYQLGVFWSQEWTAPDGDVYVDVVAYDRLESIRVTDFTISQVYQDSNLYDMATIILRDAGLHDDEFVVDERLKSMTVPYMWFPKVSHRDAIVQIAEAALGRVYCDRQGRIVVTPFTITDYPIYDFDYDKSIVDLNRPVALGQITNDVEVTAQPRVLQDMSQVYMSSDVITLDPNEVYTDTINFSDFPVINVQAPVLTADAGITITSYDVYAWGMDITYTNNNATAATVSQVTVNGQVLKVVGQRTAIASDTKSIQDNGTQSYTLKNDFIQSYQMAQQIAQSLLATYSKLRHDANISSRGNIALQLGDRITVPNKKGNKIEHVITRQALNWEGSLAATVDAQLLVVGG